MEDSLENKQALLRKEVLEGGLNAEEFIEYLGQLKNEGTLSAMQARMLTSSIGTLLNSRTPLKPSGPSGRRINRVS